MASSFKRAINAQKTESPNSKSHIVLRRWLALNSLCNPGCFYSDPLPRPPDCWNYRSVPPHWDSKFCHQRIDGSSRISLEKDWSRLLTKLVWLILPEIWGCWGKSWMLVGCQDCPRPHSKAKEERTRGHSRVIKQNFARDQSGLADLNPFWVAMKSPAKWKGSSWAKKSEPRGQWPGPPLSPQPSQSPVTGRMCEIWGVELHFFPPVSFIHFFQI